MMNNACPYRISAAAGTALARTSFLDSCHYLPRRSGFTANWAVFTNLVLLDQAFAHCPIFLTAASNMELGPCLSPNVAVHSLKPATNHWLGKPLLHQLPNSTFYYPLAINLFIIILYLTKLKGKLQSILHPFTTIFYNRSTRMC